MAPVVPHMYLVRPRESLLALRDSDPRWPKFHTSFSDAHVWSIPSAGNHDWEHGLTAAAIHLKLVFLVELHEQRVKPLREPARPLQREAHEARRSFLEAILGASELTVELFDRFWSLERAGVFMHDAHHTEQCLSLASLRLVRAPSEPANEHYGWSPAHSWQSLLDSRPRYEARVAAAVRWTFGWIAREMPELERRCSLATSVALLEQPALEAIARSLDWEPAERVPLYLTVQPLGPFGEIEISFGVRRWEPPPSNRTTALREGKLSFEISRDAEPVVESATLITEHAQALDVNA